MNIRGYSAEHKALRKAGLLLGSQGHFVRRNETLNSGLIAEILSFMAKPKLNHQRTYLAMYDITSNKVRNLVAKYLEEKGFVRIQKSVYLVSLKPSEYHGITLDISEINAMYENKDSFIFVPISDSVLAESRFIGKEIDFQLAVHPPSCLVF